MIYRIEDDDLGPRGSQGFNWFPSERAALAELKKRWQDREREELDEDDGTHSANIYGGWERYKELNFRSFRTPTSKKELLAFLSCWASYPDNG